MLIWSVKGKIIRTVLCSVMYHSCRQSNLYEQFLQMNWGLLV